MSDDEENNGEENAVELGNVVELSLLSATGVTIDPTAPTRQTFPSPEPLVIGSLFSNRQGGVNSRSPANINRIFEMDSRWNESFSYDELSNEYIYMWEKAKLLIDEDEISRAQRWLEEVYDATFGREAIRSAMFLQCKNNKRHPIRHYLGNLPKPEVNKEGEILDSKIDRFFIDNFGVSDTPLNKAYSRGFFVGAVKRAMNPGCKLDTMVVLIGAQGTGKSSAFQALCQDEAWFSDTKLHIGTKDALEQVRGTWIYEISELAAIRRANTEDIKAFLTSQFDKFRPSYERQVRTVPRTCIFVGTVNEETFVADPTGARRYWPMKVTKKVPSISSIEKQRDTLWSEAIYLYKQANGKVQYWLTDELEDERQELAHENMMDDGWETEIDQYVGDKAQIREQQSGPHDTKKDFRFTSRDVLEHLGLETHQIKHSHVIRVTAILRNIGCSRTRVRRVVVEDGESQKINYWIPPEEYKQ